MTKRPPSPDDLTPRHVRAARALLAWSQQDLAKTSGVAASTIADFERGQRTPVANNANAIRSALERAGIRLLSNGVVEGPAVQITTNSGAPIRWVSAQDLSQWADRIDGAANLPTLLTNLVRATHGSGVQLRFPSDEGIRYAGWDGRTTTDDGSEYVPGGEAGWELSAQRSKIDEKASDDFRKRTTGPTPLDPASSTFIFVSPRHWPGKGKWAKARQSEGPWREVRAYDANDLVHWIELAPAAGLWLAVRLGKRPPGTRELDEVWREWSHATKWPLTEELVLSDRDHEAAEVLRWLRGDPSVFSLQANTTDEVLAFFHAVLSELPSDLAAAYRARCIVVTTAESARALAHAPTSILLLTEPEPGLAQSLAKQGHYVLLAYDDRPFAGHVRLLARPSREGIASALTAAGIEEPRALALARDSARNLSVLRRLIPDAPGRLPRWAESPPQALLAALLVGGWDEDAETDRTVLSQVADLPYETIISALAQYVGNFDSPLQKIGSTWRVASPADAWFRLAPNLTGAHVQRFEAAALAVLGAADPRFDIAPNQRWMAAVRGVGPNHSGILRHGIGEVLILLALWGDQIRAVSNAGQRADAIVGRLFQNADRQKWWSLSRDFRLLAEASPEAFLSAVEDSLDQNDPPIGALFGHDEGGLFGTEHLSDLMWALESLAWSPNWFPQVTHVLARLDALDTKPRQFSNGPASSLHAIHLLWNPQTWETLGQRLRALDLIRRREPNAAWKLMVSVLPRGHDSITPTAKPRWRDFTVDSVETVTWSLIGRGASAISERLLADVGLNPERWSQILVRIGDMAPDQERFLDVLDEAEPQIAAKSDRAILWAKLREVLHLHRMHSDADWSLPETVLVRLNLAYDCFAPPDPLERAAWLFQSSVKLPNPAGWESEERDIDVARRKAAREVYADSGSPGVLALARLTEAASYVGKALSEIELPALKLDALLETAIRSDNDRERNLAHGLIVSMVRDRNRPWAEALIAQAKTENWGDRALLTIFHALEIERWTWTQVAAVGGEVELAYWRQMSTYLWSEDSDEFSYAICKLISVGRARDCLRLASRKGKTLLPSNLLVEVLQKAVLQARADDEDRNESNIFQHYVSDILQILDERDDVDRNVLVALEWSYLQVLEYSQRPPKAILRELSEQPSLFIQMLSAVYTADEESGVLEPKTEDIERARAFAEQAARLLELWNRVPGTRHDATIDGDTLEGWIKAARSQAKAAGREKIADIRIGNMLSASPFGSDGNWPAEAVRDVIDLFRSKPMISGFCVGKQNRRGVTNRMPRDGGELERQEAARYRTWATAVAYEHPHTAKALRTIADDYELGARHHDERAGRRDWEL
jgi:transcriptional regulator with XRE-family HTH domain